MGYMKKYLINGKYYLSDERNDLWIRDHKGNMHICNTQEDIDRLGIGRRHGFKRVKRLAPIVQWIERVPSKH
jgi:hypothetical protein